MISARLIDTGTPTANVFGYTFASPRTTTNPSASNANINKYNSIFNIVNSDDLITGFPFSDWGFTWYGKTASKSIRTNYKSQWQKLIGENYESVDSVDVAYQTFVDTVDSRNDCYNYTYVSQGGVDYTEAVYNSYPDIAKEYCHVLNGKIYQSPMFLIKCFAAVPCNQLTGKKFIDLKVSSILDDAHSDLLNELGVRDQLKFEVIACLLAGIIPVWLIELEENVYQKFAHPHESISYVLLSQHITSSNFQ